MKSCFIVCLACGVIVRCIMRRIGHFTLREHTFALKDIGKTNSVRIQQNECRSFVSKKSFRQTSSLNKTTESLAVASSPRLSSCLLKEFYHSSEITRSYLQLISRTLSIQSSLRVFLPTITFFVSIVDPPSGEVPGGWLSGWTAVRVQVGRRYQLTFMSVILIEAFWSQAESSYIKTSKRKCPDNAAPRIRSVSTLDFRRGKVT